MGSQDAEPGAGMSPWWDSFSTHSQRLWGRNADSPDSGRPPHPQLFVVGGFDGLQRLCSVERYDPFSNTWAAAAPLPEAVSSAAVAPCAGRLYVMGGAGRDGVSNNKVGWERAVEACCVPGAELGLSCPRPGTEESSPCFRQGNEFRDDPKVTQ